jgi:hypothetical protein
MRKGLIAVLTLALALALAVPALAAEVRGVTPTTIKIGQWGPQTGPAALWGSVARGTGVYFQMLNDEGGINGRKIEYFLRDDGYQPNRTKAIAKELLDNVGVFGFASGVGTSRPSCPCWGGPTGTRPWARICWIPPGGTRPPPSPSPPSGALRAWG